MAHPFPHSKPPSNRRSSLLPSTRQSIDPGFAWDADHRPLPTAKHPWDQDASSNRAATSSQCLEFGPGILGVPNTSRPAETRHSHSSLFNDGKT
ncbi:hypothetical protein ElyMa_001841500 [Elysia marginata]|uniref:Uncharacterized protein n=1 Tax=Elysia marginata TaxID=1093978 RepID=A0AAV4ELY1_9GAST|nr:hypothetical protein ElyMa_001841500 [Elysia marginata]